MFYLKCFNDSVKYFLSFAHSHVDHICVTIFSIKVGHSFQYNEAEWGLKKAP